MPDWPTLTQGTQSVTVDPRVGTIRALRLHHGGRDLDPLHRAPWLDDPEILSDPRLLPVEARLSGDFFCLPFGSDGRPDLPAHGWTANTPWTPEPADPACLRLTLEARPFGARIDKTLRLAPAAPLLLQTHRIDGGTGSTTLAHHPMVRLAGKGRLSCSPKALAVTPAQPLEPGRHVLSYPAETTDLTRLPGRDGPVDLTRLPIGTRHEDFVTLVEATGQSLGWTAVLRDSEDDIVFVLKNPAVLPVTMLWFSNGGRDYAPWNGRHLGVIGIEDGCASGAGGLAEAQGPNRVAALGVPTVLPLGPERRHGIDHVIGAIPRPAGWSVVRDIRRGPDGLTLEGDTGAPVRLPMPPDWLT